MKKIIALVMVLSMLMSCTAFAEKTSTQTTAQIYINPQLVTGADEAVLTLVETINSLVFTTTKGDNVVTVAYGANDADICDYTVATNEEGSLFFFSSLYPNTVILLDFAKVAALIQHYLPVDMDELLMQAQGAVSEISNMLTPYATDVYMLLATLESQVIVDESNMNAYLSITSQHLGQLIYDWASRLSADNAMYAVVNTVYDLLTQNDYYASSFSEFLAQLKQEAAELKNGEAMEIATLGVYQGEDGSVCYELTVANQLLVSVNAYTYEGYECLDMFAVVCSGTDSWQEVYDGICDGSNYNDMLFGINYIENIDYSRAELYMTQAGSTVTLSAEETIAPDKTTGIFSLDLTEDGQTINLGGIAAETVTVDDYTMPSLDDKYVLDVMALPVDMLMNGLPQLVEGITAGMPEMVNMVLGSLSEVEGLEFLQMLTIPVNEAPDQVTEITTTTVTSNDEIAPSDDEIAPKQETQVDGMIEDM